MKDGLMECLINPIKCRIILQVQELTEATAKQLAAKLPDIPQATLYRYLNRLLKDGALEIVRENQVRGVAEKVYAITESLILDAGEVLTERSGKLYMQMFMQYMMGFLKEFQEYTDRGDIDILHDGTGFSVVPVYATLKELEDAMTEIGGILKKLHSNPPSSERSLHSIGTIITPPKTCADPRGKEV